MSSEDAQPGQSPGIRQITDARTLRALAHPVRIALIEELIHGGALTATEIGERIGETPTTCSFHLRQLAKYGFVEEAGGGQGRSRPWRLTSIGWSFSPGLDPAAELASEAAFRLFRERQLARYETWRRTRSAYSPEWREASADDGYLFYLTVEELAQLNQELREVLMRWFQLEGRLDDPSRRPAGAVPVEGLLLDYPIDSPPAVAPDPAAPPDPPAPHPVADPAEPDPEDD
jgi:DNA-binding transcriptional ArsR family regulator